MRDRLDHSDRTADAAIGAASKEWKQMAAIAVKIRSGNCDPIWAEEQSASFKGIYKRLLEDPIDEVKKEAKR